MRILPLQEAQVSRNTSLTLCGVLLLGGEEELLFQVSILLVNLQALPEWRAKCMTHSALLKS